MGTSYVTRDRLGMYAKGKGSGPGPALMGADTLLGNDVFNTDGEHLGDIKEFMIDMASGKVAYAVLSFGGLLGMGGKLFAIPFNALAYNFSEDEYVMDIAKHRMAAAPGFDASRWPTFADEQWGGPINSFFNTPPYWNNTADKQNGGRSSASR